MRLLATIALAIVFTAAFVAYFIGAGIVSHTTDAGDVVASAKDGDLHGLFVDVIAASVEEEASSSPDPEFRAVVGPMLRPLIREVMPEAWFYETLAIAYGGFADVLVGGEHEATVDLGARVDELRTRLYGLGDRALESCRALAGATQCRTELGGETVVRDFREGVDNVMKAIPRETSLSLIIDDLGRRVLPPEMAESRAVRDSARTLRLIRWGAAALLVVLALLIALLNRPITRALAVVGLIVALASLTSIVVGEVATTAIDEELHREFSRQLASADDDPVVALAVRGTERVIRAQIGGALGDQNALVVGWLVGGALSLGLGLALTRRRRGHP